MTTAGRGPVRLLTQGVLPRQNAFGQFWSAVFLNEMAGVDAGVRLARCPGDMFDQRTVRVPEDRVATSEDGKEGFLPSAQGVPSRPIGRNRRIVG